jgi:hypothetical protein
MVMELSWVALWTLVLFRSRVVVSYWTAFAVFGLMSFSAYLVTLWMDTHQISLRMRRIVLAVMILTFLLAGLKILLYSRQTIGLLDLLNLPVRTFQDMYNLLPSEFILMLLVLWVTWRGVTRVGKPVSSEEAIGEFRVGVLMFLGFGIFANLARAMSGMELYLFLFAGLLAMSAARISVISYLRGGQRIPFDKRWMAGMGLIILAMVGLAAEIMHLAGAPGGNILGKAVTWIIYGLAIILSPLMLLVMQALIALGRILNAGAIIQALVELANRLQRMIDAFTRNIEDSLEVFTLPPILQRLADALTLTKPVVLWGIVIVFVVTILLIARSQVFRERADEGAELEKLDEQEGLIDQLRKALRKSLGVVAESLDQALRLRNARRLLAAARIRRVYAHLMHLSERLEQPRPASRTPLEFLPNLEALFPGFQGELGTITEAYLRVRYGDFPEQSEDVEAVEDAWKRVSQVGYEKVKEARSRKK